MLMALGRANRSRVIDSRAAQYFDKPQKVALVRPTRKLDQSASSHRVHKRRAPNRLAGVNLMRRPQGSAEPNYALSLRRLASHSAAKVKNRKERFIGEISAQQPGRIKEPIRDGLLN